MQLSDFHFDLPDELIAKYPAAKRSESRLLCLGDDLDLAHMKFHESIQLLNPGDLLVFNDTRVIPARIFGQKSTGCQVEILVERILDETRLLAQVRVSKPPKIGDELLFPEHIRLRVIGKQDQFYELSYEAGDRTILAVF